MIFADLLAWLLLDKANSVHSPWHMTEADGWSKGVYI